jgi:hypothetical protein
MKKVSTTNPSGSSSYGLIFGQFLGSKDWAKDSRSSLFGSRLAKPGGALRFRFMTLLLEKAVTTASALPEAEQDAVASVILSELEAEQRWGQLFQSSQDVLGLMAREALEEYRAGETAPLDLERDFPKD